MLRSAILGAAALALTAPAFAANFVFETEQPVAEKHVIAESVVWTCEGTTCVGDLDRKKASVRICKKIAKEVGVVTALRNDSSELTRSKPARPRPRAKALSTSRDSPRAATGQPWRPLFRACYSAGGSTGCHSSTFRPSGSMIQTKWP